MAENWSINYLLSDLLGGGASTQPNPREEIWASDLGKSYFDIYHKMIGTPYTNPVDGRGMMTFLLGKSIEKGIYEMLKSVGLVYDSQERIKIEVEGCLPVVGRPDLILKVDDWGEVIKNIDQIEEREYRAEGLKQIIYRYAEQYPNGLRETPFEIKSINSMALRYNKTKGMAAAYPQHHLQLYTYMRHKGYKEGHLLYVAKDTGYIEEVIVFATPELEKNWLTEVKNISHYVKNKIEPPCEPSQINGKAIWQIEYSNYKDLIKVKNSNSEGEAVKTIIRNE